MSRLETLDRTTANYTEMCTRAAGYFRDHNTPERRFPPVEDSNNHEYEIRFAILLEQWRLKGLIDDWVKVPSRSRLDCLIVDFLVLINGALYPIQVTSTSENARKHRQHIESIYPGYDAEKLPIAIVIMRKGDKSPLMVDVNDEEMYERLMTKIQTVDPVWRKPS